MVGFFFFQAEDGIRDRTVTGVQTCALPISIVLATLLLTKRPILRAEAQDRPLSQQERREHDRRGEELVEDLAVEVDVEIGRASCRERVGGRGGGWRVQERG